MNYTKLNKFKEATGKSYEQTASTTRDNFFISSVSTHVWKKKKCFQVDRISISMWVLIYSASYDPFKEANERYGWEERNIDEHRYNCDFSRVDVSTGCLRR